MKQKFENNKHNKDGPGEKNYYPLRSIISEKNNDESNSTTKQGFVAWPEKTLPVNHHTDDDIEVMEGRTKGGGYVAYPKKKPATT